jgi:hypothetical protein
VQREEASERIKDDPESVEVALAHIGPEDLSHRDIDCSRRCYKSPGCEVPLRDD